MTGALIGLAATVIAALLGLVGVLRTGRAPSHLADVQGLGLLINELQEERNGLRAQLDECRAECKRWRESAGSA